MIREKNFFALRPLASSADPKFLFGYFFEKKKVTSRLIKILQNQKINKRLLF